MVARFYGWTDREIESMEAKKFVAYINCIESLEAREILNNITVSQYPHLKNNRMKETLMKLKRTVKSVIRPTRKSLATYGDTMAKIGALFGRR